MKRTLARESRNMVGERVHLQGWADKVRDLGGIAFVVLRDRSGSVQCVLEGASPPPPGSVVQVKGRVRADQRAPGGAEVVVEEMEVLASPVEAPPLDAASPVLRAGLEALLEHRAVSLRNERIRAVFRVQAELSQGFRSFLRERGFCEIHTPKIVATGTEGGSELFPLRYFEREAFLAQSPQFYKQIMVGSGLERVFEVAPVYRAEKHDTSRHLNEYVSMDLEMGFIEGPEDVMDLEEEMLHYIFESVRERCGEELRLLGSEVPDLSGGIPRLTYDEAVSLIGRDLDPEGERQLCAAVGSELVFVTSFPAEQRPFYTMPAPGGRTRSFDLIFRGLEVTTGGQRIHSYDMLLESIEAAGLRREGMEFYLEAFKAGMPPHGGLAIGLERLTMKLLGLGNVREASLFPRDRHRLTP